MRTAPVRRAALAFLLFACGCTTNGPPPACPKDESPAPRASAQPSAAAPGAHSEPFKVLPEDASPVTFDKMSVYPPPGTAVPRGVSVTPDKKSILFLAGEDGGQEMALFSFDLDKKASRVVA